MTFLLEALNGLSNIVLAALCFFAFFRWEKKQDLESVGKAFALMGFVFLVFGSLNIAWAAGWVKADVSEMNTVASAFNIAKTILMLFILHKTFGERKTMLLFHAYWILIIACIYFNIEGLRAADIVSFGLPLMVFIYLVVKSNFYLKKAGLAGIFYSLTSLTFVAISYRGGAYEDMFWFLDGVMLFGVLYYLYKDIDTLGLSQSKAKKKEKKKGGLKKAMAPAKHLIFIIFLISFTFLSTVSIHEIGHAAVANYYGCNVNKVVIYDADNTAYTAIKCKSYYSELLLTLGGIAATTLAGMVFMLLGLSLMNSISYMIVGFGFLISYGDIVEIGLTPSLMFLVGMSGFIVMVFGIIRLTSYCFKGENLLEKANEKIN